MRRIVGLAFVGLGFAPLGVAQFDHRWAEFQPGGAMLQPLPTAVSSTTVEVAFAHGDLDQDGWLDLVVVRKVPFDSLGPQTNLLLLNQGGVLVDRTSTHAVASDVPGDQGFLTPTCDTGVALADLDGDGLLDVVTAAQGSAAVPKAVGHPRIHRNLGFVGGVWAGLRHEEARIPQLLHTGTGLPAHPRFSSVSTGDVDGDGDVDLYFSDNDGGFGSPAEPATADTDDRILLNQGNGFFVDGSTLATTAALASAFGIGGTFVDLNLDGLVDLLKLSTNASNPGRAVYRSGATLGVVQTFHSFSPYALAVGDLNRDGRPDAVLGDDLTDRLRYNLSTAANGQVAWGPPRPFQFLSGSDDGFTGPVEIVDLDADGWPDVLISDVDVAINGFFRRLHIYHNLGGPVGSEIVPIEERQSAASTGWIGAVGLTTTDLKGTYETESFDIDRDGDVDIVQGRGAGTLVWENVTVVCQEDLGFGTAGGATLSMCGNPLKADGQAEFALLGAPASTPVYVIAGASANPTPTLGGTLVPDQVALIVSTTTSPQGRLVVPGVAAFGVPVSLVVQCAYVDGSQPSGAGFSNAIRIVSE